MKLFLFFLICLTSLADSPEVNGILVTPRSRTINTGAGLTGGGDMTADRTFVVDLSTVVANQTIFDSSQASRTITFGLSGSTDPVLTLSNNSVDCTTGVLKVGGTSVQDAAILTSGTLSVARGGSGVGTLTAYAPVFGGTTSTGPVQSGTVGNAGQVLTSNGAGALPTFQAAAGGTVTNTLTFCLSDETTTLTTGTNKVYWEFPLASTIKAVRATLSGASPSSSGLVTVDIYKEATSILSTKLTIDANERSSRTSATAAVLSTTAFSAGDYITFGITGAGTTAAGLQVQVDYTVP